MKKIINNIYRAIRRLLTCATGSTSLETGLVLPILFLVIFGTVDAGRMVWAKNAVNFAAAEGARLAMLHEPTENDITTYINEKITDRGLNITPNVVVSERTAGQPVNVTVTVPVNYLVLPAWISSALNVSEVTSTACMDYEP